MRFRKITMCGTLILLCWFWMNSEPCSYPGLSAHLWLERVIVFLLIIAGVSMLGSRPAPPEPNLVDERDGREI